MTAQNWRMIFLTTEFLFTANPTLRTKKQEYLVIKGSWGWGGVGHTLTPLGLSCKFPARGLEVSLNIKIIVQPRAL